MSKSAGAPTTGGPKSGFTPYPAEGFDIVPPQNYWEGGNFMMPGVSQSPMMTSNLMQRSPALAPFIEMRSPPDSGVRIPSRVGALAEILRGPERDGEQKPTSPLARLLQMKG
jgi:hypothetical protein